jgi:hypothetical protein
MTSNSQIMAHLGDEAIYLLVYVDNRVCSSSLLDSIVKRLSVELV